MVGQVIRKSTREKKDVDYFLNKKPADCIPSKGMTFQRVNSDSRSAENQAAAAHFEEETAKQEGQNTFLPRVSPRNITSQTQ